jgi:MFS family permease
LNPPGAWTGSVADAVDKRKLLIGTQAAQGLLALVLGILALTGVVELWMVWILALGLGVARSFDTPTRQAFVSELVQVRRCRGRSGSTRPWCPRRA